MQCELFLGNCLDKLKQLPNDFVDFNCTDIPYDKDRRTRSLKEYRGGAEFRKVTKDDADIITFNLSDFLEEVYRTTKNSIVIFCGAEQFSEIYGFFTAKAGTTRKIIWEKTNPSPMNGQYIYESGVELAVWFKKRGAKVFNAFCKNTVFRYPNGSSKIHPTEKNHKLLAELLLDNTNENNLVMDCCMGSGSMGMVSVENKRNFLGCEINPKYFNIAKERIEKLL